MAARFEQFGMKMRLRAVPRPGCPAGERRGPDVGRLHHRFHWTIVAKVNVEHAAGLTDDMCTDRT
jgi:hypothetical protein